MTEPDVSSVQPHVLAEHAMKHVFKMKLGFYKEHQIDGLGCSRYRIQESKFEL